MSRLASGPLLICLLAVLSGCRTPAPEAPRKPPELPVEARPPADYFLYELRRGDTLYSLGQRFGVPWQDILRLSDIRDPRDIRVGKTVLIRRMPGVEPPELTPAVQKPPADGPRITLSEADLHRGKASARFWWPTKGRLVRSYGAPVRGFKEPGIGIAAPRGTDVCAVADGTVIACVREGDARGAAWGKVVAVAHSGGMVSWYAQLDRMMVEKGTKVKQGQAIGTVGASGAAAAPELAFRLFHNERPINPADILP